MSIPLDASIPQGETDGIGQEPPLLGIRYGIGFRRCNLDCPYCVAEWRKRRDMLDVDIFHAILDEIEKIPRSINLRFGIGGEAFICPPFLEKVIELSHKDGPIKTMSFSSNIQADWDTVIHPFLDRVDTSKLGMGATLHDKVIDDVELFFEKARRIRESGVELYIGYVALPGCMDLLREYKLRADDIGAPFLVNPYVTPEQMQGSYNKRGIGVYTKEEERELADLLGSTHVYQMTIQRSPTFGMRCSAGKDYLVIHSDGGVFACNREHQSKGNILDGPIALQEKDTICPFLHCWCPNENQALRIVDRKYLRNGRTLRVIQPKPGLTSSQLTSGYSNRFGSFAFRLLRSPGANSYALLRRGRYWSHRAKQLVRPKGKTMKV
ncbi:MAG: radical SAM protein [Planctomycetota bacterium]